MLRIGLVTLCVLSSTAAAFGEIWSSSQWALTGEGDVGVGYDSNLYTRNGGAGDGYLLVVPTLTLQKLGSAVDLHFDAALQSYTFFDLTNLNTLNPSLNMVLKYPQGGPDTFPTEEVDAVIARTTEENVEVGGRLRRQDLGINWNGNIVGSEKTILEGSVNLHQTDYLTTGFNDNDLAAAGLKLAYVENELLQFGVGYTYTYSESLPRGDIGVRSNFQQNLGMVWGKGEFLSKVTGTFFFGVADTAYHGPTSNTNVDFEGNMTISWQATDKGQLALAFDREVYFSPDGYAFIPTSLGPEWTQDLINGYSLTAGVGAEEILYRFTESTRLDHSYGGHLGLKYSASTRFTASVSVAYTKQTSPEYITNYHRGTVFGDLSYKF